MHSLDGWATDFNNMTGSIPTEIGLLKNMTIFHGKIKGLLSCFYLNPTHPFLLVGDSLQSGTVPSEIGLCESLGSVTICHSQTAGQLQGDVVFTSNELAGELPRELGSFPNFKLVWVLDAIQRTEASLC